MKNRNKPKTRLLIKEWKKCILGDMCQNASGYRRGVEFYLFVPVFVFSLDTKRLFLSFSVVFLDETATSLGGLVDER